MKGLTTTSATCPPQVVPVREHFVPVLEFSSKRTISKPSFWKAAFFTSGSMLVCSQCFLIVIFSLAGYAYRVIGYER